MILGRFALSLGLTDKKEDLLFPIPFREYLEIELYNPLFESAILGYGGEVRASVRRAIVEKD